MSVRPRKIPWYETNLYVVSILTSFIAWVLDVTQVNRRFGELGWNFFIVHGIILALVWASVAWLTALDLSTGRRLSVWLSPHGVTRMWDYGAIAVAGVTLLLAWLFGTVSAYHIGGAILLLFSAIQALWRGRGKENPNVPAGASTQS